MIETPLSSLEFLEVIQYHRRFIGQLSLCEHLEKLDLTVIPPTFDSFQMGVGENEHFRHLLTHVSVYLFPFTAGWEFIDFVRVLPMLERLEHITLEIEDLDDETIQSNTELVQALESMPHLTSIRLLHLISRLLLEQLAPIFTRLNSVVINLAAVRNEEFPSTRSSAFRDNTTIQHLKLWGCGLSNAEITAISTILPTMTNLTHLNVDMNRFEDEGARMLRDAVLNCQSLTEVVLNEPNNSGCNEPLHIDDNIRDAIFYTCKLRKIDADRIVAEAPLSLYDLIFQRLREDHWHSIIFFLLRARNDVLIPRSD